MNYVFIKAIRILCVTKFSSFHSVHSSTSMAWYLWYNLVGRLSLNVDGSSRQWPLVSISFDHFPKIHSNAETSNYHPTCFIDVILFTISLLDSANFFFVSFFSVLLVWSRYLIFFSLAVWCMARKCKSSKLIKIRSKLMYNISQMNK